MAIDDTQMGLTSSLGCILLAIPSTFILNFLRSKEIPDSIVATSFSIYGTIFSFVIMIIMGSRVDMKFDWSSSWAAGLVLLMLFGTAALLIDATLDPLNWKKFTPTRRIKFQFSRLERTKIAIFCFSCLWELIQQGYWHKAPSVTQ